MANRQAMELLVENDYFSGSELLKILSKKYGLTVLPNEVEKLLGLEEGYLIVKETPISNNIVQLKNIRSV
ncbi:hypothetical protein LAV73_13850 [Lysinibacillus xylanilyticus]|uniref:hypothetical protein n=1 Tax=Lysinibacillus xylanilyticus TaxID=582475 RepID=UPI002B24C66B|nr:hypothetical protein [Lysinibacillus xylanilyticus]MEB2281072.1 hypothetical protein [Lysinibacillus xylanilyticus]